MKKILFSLVAATALSSSLFAGQNVAVAPIEPMPLPEKPVAPQPSILPPLGLYVGGGITYADGECVCDDTVLCSDGSSCAGSSTSTTYGVNLKAGYEFTDYLGIEGKYLYTPWGDEDKSMKHYGLYLKPNYAVTNNFDAYALLGYGVTECETMPDSESGFAWGVGTEYSFGKTQGIKDGLGVYVEYLKPIKTTGAKEIDTNVVNAGVSYHF